MVGTRRSGAMARAALYVALLATASLVAAGCGGQSTITAAWRNVDSCLELHPSFVGNVVVEKGGPGDAVDGLSVEDSGGALANAYRFPSAADARSTEQGLGPPGPTVIFYRKIALEVNASTSQGKAAAIEQCFDSVYVSGTAQSTSASRTTLTAASPPPSTEASPPPAPAPQTCSNSPVGYQVTVSGTSCATGVYVLGRFNQLPSNELPSRTTSVALGAWSCQQGPQFEDMNCENGGASIVATVCGTACGTSQATTQTTTPTTAPAPTPPPPPSTLPPTATPAAWTNSPDSTCTEGAEAVTTINTVDVLYCASTDNISHVLCWENGVPATSGGQMLSYDVKPGPQPMCPGAQPLR